MWWVKCHQTWGCKSLITVSSQRRGGSFYLPLLQRMTALYLWYPVSYVDFFYSYFRSMFISRIIRSNNSISEITKWKLLLASLRRFTLETVQPFSPMLSLTTAIRKDFVPKNLKNCDFRIYCKNCNPITLLNNCSAQNSIIYSLY